MTTNGANSGSVYVFTRSGTTWTQQAKLIATSATGPDYFGNSVSLDSSTALIGAYNGDDNGSNSGSAYIFTRSSSTWTQQAKLVASDSAEGDNFGVSVSLSGSTAFIGAYNDDDYGLDCGSAYVFKKENHHQVLGLQSQLMGQLTIYMVLPGVFPSMILMEIHSPGQFNITMDKQTVSWEHPVEQKRLLFLTLHP